MTDGPDNEGRRVRVCRPAFQDAQHLLHRYYARSELVRQVLKLRWWDPDQPCVLDLAWNAIPETELFELIVEDGYGITSGLRVIFFQPSSSDSTLWVLGACKAEEEFTEFTKAIYVGRSTIVKERTTDLYY